MRRLPPPDVGHGRNGHASEQAAAAHLVRGDPPDDQPLQWYLEQAQAQLGIRSYKTAWLLLHKLRRAMVDPNRSLLQGLVEVDESEVPLRSKHDPS